MWFKEYQDYPIDSPNIQEPVEPGKGIVGCEMHEVYGWGERIHTPAKRNEGFIRRILKGIFGK